ncbi:hypothetical protein MTBLM5_60187 [Magnetospirillum sp. LM-5]|nr:hypothetical protein MTBLM5_60187 [Magnetospirillum sp. LM-5]
MVAAINRSHDGWAKALPRNSDPAHTARVLNPGRQSAGTIRPQAGTPAGGRPCRHQKHRRDRKGGQGQQRIPQHPAGP